MPKKLIALEIIAAGALSADSVAIATGAEFEAEDARAAVLVNEKLARYADPEAAAPNTKPVRIRLLAECLHGKVNDVVTLSATAAQEALGLGVADADKAAVAYALTLPQNQPAQ
jgi:hypothetical protein